MPTTIKYQSLLVRSTIFVFALLMLFGCIVPNNEMVVGNFRKILAKEAGADVLPIVISVYTGEGDADNVYEHIRFDLIAIKDVTFKSGWLAGITLRKGEKLRGGKVVMLYQKRNRAQWTLSNYQLKQSPR